MSQIRFKIQSLWYQAFSERYRIVLDISQNAVQDDTSEKVILQFKIFQPPSLRPYVVKCTIRPYLVFMLILLFN